jgi:hypothetical protein
MDKGNNSTIVQLILNALALLLIGHLAYQAIINNLIINFLSLGLIILFLLVFYLKKSRNFEFILIIFICNHFDFLGNWGGLFVLATCLSLFFYFVLSKKKIFLLTKDMTINLLLAIFIMFNILGWIFKNKMAIEFKIAGIISFFGYIFAFLYVRNHEINEKRIRYFYILTCVLSVYNLIISLNNYFAILYTELTPLIPTSPSRFGKNIMAGTFDHSELYGEYGLVIFLFYLPCLINSSLYKVFRIPRMLIIVGLLSSYLNLVLSFARSVFVLAFIGILIFLILSFKLKIYKVNFLKLSIYAIIGFLIILLLWRPLRMNYTIRRFTEKELAAPINIDDNIDLVTGEGTPRQVAFSYFFERLPQESWWIGYGWGVPTSNRIAWFGDPTINRADYHSLYLSLPMLYGWIGSISFLLIILVTIKRLYKVMLSKNIILVTPAFSLLMILLFVLFDEYKISMLRISTYHMLFWIWLGISNAIYLNYKSTRKYIVPYESSLVSPISN